VVQPTASSESSDDDVRLDLRVLAPIWATVFVGMFWISSVRPFARQLADDLQTSVSLVGQLTTFAMLSIAVAGLFAGPVADHIGHKRSLIAGLALLALSSTMMAASIHVVMLLIAGLIGGTGISMTYGVALGVVAKRLSGDARSKALGITHAFGSSATIVSAPLLTIVASFTLWRGSFVFLLLSIVAATVLVMRLLPDTCVRSGEPLSPMVVLRAYRPLWDSPPAMALFGASATRGIFSVGIVAYLGAFYADRYGMSVREIGAASILEGGALVLGSLIAGAYAQRLDQRRFFAAAMVLIGLAWMTIFALKIPVLIAIGTVVGITFLIGATLTILTNLLADGTPCGAATTMVLNISVIGFGAAFGAAFGGLLIGVGGYAALGFGALPFAFAAALLVWRPSRWRAAVLPLGVSEPQTPA
jgi:MFS transporter, DHA1 family, multidrug resistance protein